MSRTFWALGVYFCFLASGATGLGYQILWFKALSYVWGNSSLAVGTVVASFLLGLGIGARAFGRLSDRLSNPLLFYGLAEIAIAIVAWFLPQLMFSLGAVESLWISFLGDSSLSLTTLRIVLTFSLLAPPCILMGGTLPLVASHFRETDAGGGSLAARLYGLNTLGAAIGCAAVGFFLIPLWGMTATNYGIVAVNFGLGVLAIGLASRRNQEARGATSMNDTPSGEAPARSRVRGVVFAAFLTGCAALILEMVWVRQLALILGGSTYAFSAVLLVMLAGMGLGSLSIRPRVDGWSERKSFHILSWVVGGIVASSVLGQHVLPDLAGFVGTTSKLRGSATWNTVLSIWVCAALQFLPALGMGLTFPLLTHILRKREGAHGGIGSAVGRVYAFNTVGTIVGALGTVLFLIPMFGTLPSVVVGLLLYVAAYATLWPEGRSTRASFLAVSALVCGLLLSLPYSRSPLHLNAGLYLYGYSSTDSLEEEHDVLFFGEGQACNVLVTEDSQRRRALRVNGKVDASDRSDMSMQVGLAYLPRFLRPEAEKVMVIGFGSGCTVGASLLMSPVQVTCCEIERNVLEASPYFHHVNHRPEKSPHLTMVFDDGRSVLSRSKERYDLILSEPSNPWLAGVASLFTHEFYEIAKSRLSRDGLLAQWIQTYSLSLQDYVMITETIANVFPHYGLFRVSDSDTILVAAQTPLCGDLDSVAKAQGLVDQSEAVRADLEAYFDTSSVKSVLLGHLALNASSLKRLSDSVGKVPLHTDARPRLEYDAPKRLFDERYRSRDVMKALLEFFEPSWLEELYGQWAGNADQGVAFRRWVELTSRFELLDKSTEIVAFALQERMDEPFFLGRKLRWAPPESSSEFQSDLLRLVDASALASAYLGVALWKQGEHRRAVAVFSELVEKEPHSATLWTNLANNYLELGELKHASSAMEEASRLDPFSKFVIDSRKELDQRALASVSNN